MKSFIILFCVSIILSCCEKNKPDINIDPNFSYEFNGDFETTNSFQSGIVCLKIDSGKYYCTTDLPYGKGAGRLIIGQNEIEFRDTLFFPIPAIYGPSWVISGKHIYTFDGSELKLSRNINNGIIKYDLLKTN